ncbi:hypothetical protein [Amycolatopsis plumensis]|uniref:Uncharacterized protein n=1 Tax=Amycolatopsis plumensis TaxID=236508 RepID=A0ABV5UIM4_9PSEU
MVAHVAGHQHCGCLAVGFDPGHGGRDLAVGERRQSGNFGGGSLRDKPVEGLWGAGKAVQQSGIGGAADVVETGTLERSRHGRTEVLAHVFRESALNADLLRTTLRRECVEIDIGQWEPASGRHIRGGVVVGGGRNDRDAHMGAPVERREGDGCEHTRAVVAVGQRPTHTQIGFSGRSGS